MFKLTETVQLMLAAMKGNEMDDICESKGSQMLRQKYAKNGCELLFDVRHSFKYYAIRYKAVEGKGHNSSCNPA